MLRRIHICEGGNNMTQPRIGVNERLPMAQMIPLGLQHLFAMFGATVLVPLLVNSGTGQMVIPPVLRYPPT